MSTYTKSWDSIDEVKAAHNGHWFDKAAMRFFGTKFESDIIEDRYFITSEQPPHGPRVYAARKIDDDADIDTLKAGERSVLSNFVDSYQDAFELIREDVQESS